ncbi:mRNA interferase RelE/StbE [Prauserella shujinwangii]|uniref:mRNA interferase RelE/StbE n=1 Tax=Prauserella shujinwangii TaxID=1453103 RepID=A0A2T0LMD1_9PSEU|nr:type II toxin-antitoxin system RelE/ParE family toxin [Prauserella shujinwangii]PRX44237.1 mRNA interferase RelE/StbE [Prauserella shujinwangii]
MARVQLTDDAREDLRDLDGSARVVVLKALRKLEHEPEKRGEPLGSRPGGDLTTFRKLVVGNRAFRIVYRVEADGTAVVVWVIGPRADAECYNLAVARLRMHGDRELARLARMLLDAAFAQEDRPGPVSE